MLAPSPQPPLVDTRRAVETPEGVQLTLRVAGPAPRALAWLIDVLVKVVLVFVLSFAVGLVGPVLGQGVAQALLLLGLFVLWWVYPVVFEVWRGGATPGKRSMGLAVVHRDGTPVRFGASSTRNLLRAADMLPGLLVPTYGFGLVSCLLSRDFQRIGDRVAGTLVVHRGRDGRRRRGQNPARPFPSPVPLSAEEQRALLEFADRAPTWTRERQVELTDVLEPLTRSQGQEGLERALGLATWIEDRP